MDALVEELRQITNTLELDAVTRERILTRLKKGNLTRDEGATDHFCVMFLAYDAIRREVFLGHHKKSDAWLFTGGHIDQDETSKQALLREIEEEWGEDVGVLEVNPPELFTVFDIENPRQSCKLHFDLWYMFPVNKVSFQVDKEKLLKEFYEIGWVSIEEALALDIPITTKVALDHLQQKLV